MCAGCVSSVEKKLAQCEGVVSATVNLVTEVAAVDCLPSVDPQRIAQALGESGYPSHIRENNSRSGDRGFQAETEWLQRKDAEQKNQTPQLAIAATLLFLSTLGHLQHLSFAENSRFTAWLDIPVISTLWFHGVQAKLTLILPDRKNLIEGFQGIRRRSPNMNTLVSLGAWAYGAPGVLVGQALSGVVFGLVAWALALRTIARGGEDAPRDKFDREGRLLSLLNLRK